MASSSRRGFLKAASVTAVGLTILKRAPSWAADGPAAGGSVQVWSTFRDRRHASAQPLTWQPVTTAIAADAIMLNPAETRQEMLGFGAAFTDAACYMLTGSHDVWPAVVDGRPDIVVGYVETPGTVYFNTGPHSFHEVPWNDGKGTVYGLAFADFNDRGRCSTLAPIRQLPGRRRPRMAFALRLTDRPR